MRLLIAGSLCWVCAFSQAAFPQGSAGNFVSSSLADQDIADIYAGISKHAMRLQPMLDQVRTDEWLAKGAPDTYVAQQKSAADQLHAILSDMTDLGQHPDNIPNNMKALFRIEAFHRTLDALLGGVRRYQNPALADLIESVAAEDRGDLDKFQLYLLDMANEKDQQFQLVDREAQRCRATLSKQPAPPPRRNE